MIVPNPRSCETHAPNAEGKEKGKAGPEYWSDGPVVALNGPVNLLAPLLSDSHQSKEDHDGPKKQSERMILPGFLEIEVGDVGDGPS